MDMLLECSIFILVSADMGNYYQLSGVPVHEVKLDEPQKSNIARVNADKQALTKSSQLKIESKKPGAITFVRSRMLYAKAALNAKGGVRFGMRHIHVLNRCTDRKDKQETVHVMRYIFPCQFGLHNVFSSKVDHRETAMPFKDYTLREKDIHTAMCRELGPKATDAQEIAKWKQRIPKRLRGDAVKLVDKLRGVPVSTKPDWRKSALQPKADVRSVADPVNRRKKARPTPGNPTVQETCFTDLACPAAHVSAFCRAVISKVIPERFWGNEHNHRTLMYWVDQFVDIRRFESLNLHQVTQNIQITNIAWLRPPSQDDDTKVSKSDMDKRTEIFLEFVYWLFDSFLVPLVRTNFHVTESNAHRNRLFYFRHDIWRMLTEPALKELRMNMFEEMPTESTERLLSARQLGFSNVRLLPKKQGFRTIMNLKRRQQVMRYGTITLGRSINSVMTPAFNAITYEKVDVQACFDTIPQSRLLRMIDSLMSIQAYNTGKHVEISPLGPLQRLGGKHVDPMPLKKYIPHTEAATGVTPFHQLVQDRLAGTKANTIFVNTNMQRRETKDDLMQLLQEHIERNVVRIGKRFYRQKTGIPQGSVLSSILCNFFYAQLERDVLGFVLDEDSLLLRLLDDFLLISINEEYAQRFVSVMHKGHPEYGVVIKPSKSMANFDVTTEGGDRIATSGSDGRFPYCGVCIDTTTLEVSKKTERPTKTGVEDSLTVDLTRMPGQTFHRKALK
ncbi:hypothetical protein J4E85_005495 [Alternaria conjuncta]|uniref:uncharacterized protein n=1 Tax=Alternaria conjuncta TaxID=181017 RepID=UPI0022206E36|nr:uncharacterized protein J4E85_005495 [Alternaria conjuncta]KAI4928873.1 hypothetical protein J4E85_005495 [Alternaria conjuncta]